MSSPTASRATTSRATTSVEASAPVAIDAASGRTGRPSAAELAALARRDEKLGRLLGELPPFPGYPERANDRHGSNWNALASAIVYQQLHGKAAATIWGRLCGMSSRGELLRPADMLAVPTRKLRAAGLSRQKILALRDLAERIDDGRLPLARIGRAEDDEIVARLTEVRGIGDWSARMFLMFRLGRLDVMAETDFGIQEGVRMLDELAERPSPREVFERGEAWRPLRTVGCWAMWRLVERTRARARLAAGAGAAGAGAASAGAASAAGAESAARARAGRSARGSPRVS